MESNGPDVKVRGTAKQIFDKYETLARDAASSGQRVKAENYRQHAEHYLRIVNEIEDAKEKARLEAEAAKAEAGESSDGDDKEDGKSRRRYPPQVRKSDKDSDNAETATESDSEEQDETVVEEPPQKESSRRRKAPSRDRSKDDASKDDEAAAEAAE